MSLHFGLLNLHKPAGVTSRQVVNQVQRLARRTKFGHAGTLDPLASGVLIVCAGAATRLIQYIQRMPKRYTGTFLLGRRSATEDVDGEVTALDDPPIPAREQIVLAARGLTGKIEQRPPAYSALRVDGQRAHALARQGHEVELKPRPVVVYRLEVVAYDYPELRLEIECGSGTYVRSLGRDLAESLGTAAVMSGLVRTAVGSLVIDEAVAPSALSRDDWTGRLLPPERAVELLPRVELNLEEIAEIRAGRSIERSASSCGSGDVAAFDAAGRLLAILVPRGAGLLGPTLNLPSGE